MPQRIMVLGGSGPSGRLIVSQALAHGHTVSVLSRHPEQVGLTHAALNLITGDVLGDPAALAASIRGHDIVISALGRGLRLKSDGLMTRATPALITAMQSAGVKRLIYLSAIGVGGTAPTAPLIFRIIWRVMLAGIYGDKAIAEPFVSKSGLDWTILAPVILTDDRGTGRFRLSEGSPPAGPWRMTRADLATATLSCVDNAGTIRKRLVVQTT